MPQLKPLSYRELIKRLTSHDNRFEISVRRGKGSERMIYHPDIGSGITASYPIKCHGAKTEIRQGHLSAITRRFNLPRNLLKS